MESNEKQLISSLVKVLIEDKNQNQQLVLHSLYIIPHYKYILNFLSDLLSKTQDNEVKIKIALLYFHYILEKSELLENIDNSILFDQYKKLICETPTLKSIDDYKIFSDVMVLLIGKLTSFTENSFYSLIISWSNQNTKIALFALSEVYCSFSGSCIINIMSNFNNELSTLAPLGFWLSSHTFNGIDDKARTSFSLNNSQVLIANCIKACISNENNGLSPDSIKLGFFVFGSVLHFLTEEDSVAFYLQILPFINPAINLENYTEKEKSFIRLKAIEALENLPISDNISLNNKKQISKIINLFGKHIKFFFDDISNAILSFIEKRMNEKIKIESIISKMFKDSSLTLCATMLSCKFNLVSKFYREIFPIQCNTEEQANAACSAILYLNEQKQLEGNISSQALVTLLSASKFECSNLLKIIPPSLDILFNFLSYEQVVNEFYNNCLLLLEHNKSLTGRIILVFISYLEQKNKENKDLSLVLKQTNEKFISNFYPFLKKFILCKNDDPLCISYISFLAFLNSTITGYFIDFKKYFCSPLLIIIKEFIPQHIHELLYKTAKNEYDLSRNSPNSENSTHQAITSGIIAFSLKSSKEINPSDIIGLMLTNPFFNFLLEKFFVSLIYLDPNQFVEYFVTLASSSNDNDSTFFQRAIKTFFFQPTMQNMKFSRNTVMSILNNISDFKMNSKNLSALFSLFENIYDYNIISLTTLSKLSKQHVKCQISEKFVHFIISSNSFYEVIPDFLYNIENFNEKLLRISFETFFQYASNEKNTIKRMITSAFDNLQPPENVYNAIVNQLLSASNIFKIIDYSQELSKRKDIPSKYFSKLALKLVQNALSNDEHVRTQCFKSLRNIFSKQTHDSKSKSDETEFINHLKKLTFNEMVDKLVVFFEKYIVDSPEFEDVAQEMVNSMFSIKPIEIPIAVLIFSICKSNLYTKLFLEDSQLILYLTKEGNSKYGMIKYFINNSLQQIIEKNMNNFLNTVCIQDMNNEFTRKFLSSQVKKGNFHHEIINFTFFQFVKSDGVSSLALINDNDVNYGKVQLFSILCSSNHDHKNDLKLIWLACIVFSSYFSSNRNLSILSRNECRSLINMSLKNIFSRLRFDCPKIEERDFLLVESFSKRIAQFVFTLTLSDIKEFIEIRKEFENNKKQPISITVIITFVLSYILKLFIRLRNIHFVSQNSNSNYSMNWIHDSKGEKGNDIEISNSSSNQEYSDEINTGDDSTIGAGNKIYIENQKSKIDKTLSQNQDLAELANDIATFSVSSNDECCRILTAKFASLFTVSNLKIFPDEGKEKLLISTIRSLIIPDKNTQNSNLIFLSMILTVCPQKYIKKEVNRLFDAITRCFDLKEIVGIEILLDSIFSIIKVDSSIEPFNNMSHISIARLFILIVNDNAVIREKSLTILEILSSTNYQENIDNTDIEKLYLNIIKGLVNKIGDEAVTFFGNFFVEWCTKNGFNNYAMSLILSIVQVLKENTSSSNKFINQFFIKTNNALISHVTNPQSPYQKVSIEILSLLMK